MARTSNKVKVSFPGLAACQVSGSMTLVEYEKEKILIEAGLSQGGTVLQDWRDNTRRLPFRVSDISYIFLGHCHTDHAMLIPRLFSMGCRARIVAPTGTRDLFVIMGNDSAHIVSKDAEYLSRTTGRSYEPYYTADDVALCAEHIDEYDIGERHVLNEALSFRFVPSGHIINSAQIELWVKSGCRTVKIGYTSDIGGHLPKRYVNKFERIGSCNLLIGESTRAYDTRPIGIRDRKTDLAKIETVIDETCGHKRGKVLLPVFSLDRAQNMLSVLYDIYGRSESFETPILIDSPLCVKLFEYYKSHLHGKELEHYTSMLSWGNLVWTNDYTNSKAWQKSDRPAVILASSGMMQAGRARQWATTLLEDERSHIMFCGFATDNSLAGKIKRRGFNKVIQIDGTKYKCRCGVTDLKSFSGHMGRERLLDYYSGVQADKIALVHGEQEHKVRFADDLREALSQNGKSTRVICVNKGTEIMI